MWSPRKLFHLNCVQPKKLFLLPNIASFHCSKISNQDESGENESNLKMAKEKTLNQVLLLGRCGSDPQKRGSESKPVILFPLATSTYFETNDGTQAVRTDWHRIAVFKIKLGENVVKYMKKGRRVMVQGKILYGEVKDPDGKTRQTTTIAADDVTYVDASRRTED